MEKISYKNLHEQFMQNHNGTTPVETVLVIAPTAVTVVLLNCLAVFLPRLVRSQTLLVEFIVLVVPLILHATTLSEHIAHSLLLMTVAAFSYLLPLVLKSPLRASLTWSGISSSLDMSTLITNFRGTVNLITAICILAVDFRTFPRRFAKTEVRGWGIMDTGVGLFVVSNGLVDPAARGAVSSVRVTLRGCAPLLGLGLVRCLSTWGLDYQQHVSEYGLHWNFFVTLAVTRLASALMLHASNRPLSWAVLCIKAHHVLLVGGLATWVLGDAPRDTLVSANREGLCSLLGYVALHQCSVTLGYWMRAQKDQRLFLPKMAVFGVLAWTAAILFGPPSRRLADLSYVAWILAYACTMLTLFLVARAVSSVLSVLSQSPPYSPMLLAAINFNGLPFFLLANLLTGVINMSVNTLYVAPLGSVVIVTMYLFLLCLTFHKLYVSRLKLKCW